MQPIHFDEPPRVCPRCLTSNWQQRDRLAVMRGLREEDGTEIDPFTVPRGYETYCATCQPDLRPKRTIIHGQDPDTGRGPFNF